jgi:2-methylcitrate dehydratase PrpD
MASATQVLAEYIAGCRFEALSREVVDATVRCIQDLLGVALAGVKTPWAEKVASVAAASGGTSQATLWGRGRQGSVVAAALVNGTAAHALDYDDDPGCCHIGAVIIPAALAVAEVQRSTPQEFLTAVCAGYDVTTRVSDGIDPALLYARGYHPTSVCGVFGAAAAAGRLMRLPPEVVTNGLGIAGSFSAGNLEFLSDGAMTKRLQAGKAAADGVLAAQLAAEGFTGPRSVLEGPYGLWRYTERRRAPAFTADLGVRYAVREVHFKQHACCLGSAAAVDGVLELIAGERLGPADIESLRVGLCQAGYAIVAEPYPEDHAPANMLEAQMSLRFTLAVAGIDGIVGAPQFADERLRDRRVLALARRIHPYLHPALASAPADDVTAYIDLTTRDGRTLSRVQRTYRGHPEDPMSAEELTAKFLRNARVSLPEGRCAALLEAVRGLPALEGLSPLLDALRGN